MYIYFQTQLLQICYLYSNYFYFRFLYSRTNSFNVVALRALSDKEFHIFGPLNLRLL